MKTLMTSAALLPLLIGCGGATHSNAQAVQSECSYSVRGNDADAVRLALNSVLEGQIDPCGGAVKDLRFRNLQLHRVDVALDSSAQRVFALVFHVSANEAVARNQLNATPAHLD
jgi:hypothetical protein